jgi:hypothetical protein
VVTELPNLSPTPIRACPLPEPCHPLGLPNSLGSCLSSMHIPLPIPLLSPYPGFGHFLQWPSSALWTQTQPRSRLSLQVSLGPGLSCLALVCFQGLRPSLGR